MRIVVLDGYTLNPTPHNTPPPRPNQPDQSPAKPGAGPGSGDNPWTPIAALGQLTAHDRTPPDQILPRAAGADILLTNKVPLSADTLRQLPGLKYIGVLATGYNIVDIDAARELGIPVTNVPEYGTDSVAQFTFALLLELCHHVGLHSHAVKAGEWSAGPDWSFWKSPLIELAGLTLGIIGYGRIGRRVEHIAGAFGMNVIHAGRDDWQHLLPRADVLSLHCPLTPDNAGMINTRTIDLMKPSAMLINTARGGLIAEQDLADALNTHRLAAAALDVASTEPIKPDNPLLRANNCLITPHIAWATLAARQRLMQIAAQNIAAFQRGQPINVVNNVHSSRSRGGATDET